MVDEDLNEETPIDGLDDNCGDGIEITRGDLWDHGFFHGLWFIFPLRGCLILGQIGQQLRRDDRSST